MTMGMAQSEEFLFRCATNRDVDGCWGLISSVLAEYGIVADGATTEGDLLDIEASYWGAGGAFFLLLDGTMIIGTVALRREPAGVCELCRMYLAASYRGRGLGRRLFEKAFEEAKRRGFDEIRLETAAVLTEAIALYESAGFVLVEEKPRGKNCNLVMRRRVS
jgi:putative acetyltransferase